MVAIQGLTCVSAGALRELRPGAWVTGTDGPLGRLCHVLLAPGTLRVTGIILRAGRWGSRSLRIPLEAVLRAEEDEIRLALTKRAAYELWREQVRQIGPSCCAAEDGVGEEPRPVMKQPDEVTLGDGCRVTARDGTAGRLRALLIDGFLGTVEEFVIEGGCLASRRWRLPVTWIRSLTGSTLVIDATRAAVARLPQFRTDRELRGEILDAWFYDDFLRPLHLCGSVNVRVHEGVAEVEGYAWSYLHRRRLEARARLVPGIRDVRCAVVADDELAHQVELALRRDRRTWLLRPDVKSDLGIICLKGEAPDRSTREAASEVAADQPSVRGVRNRLRVAA